MNLAYNITTLAGLYSLTSTDIMALIESEGVLAYDPSKSSTVGYIPTLDAYFVSTPETEHLTRGNTKAEWFKITNVNDIWVVALKGNCPNVPVTAYLYTNTFTDLHFDNLSIDEALIPPLNGKQMFIASKELISRLSSGVSGEYTTIHLPEPEKK